MNTKNLQILASGLAYGKVKPAFDMTTFADNNHLTGSTRCGTVGCAIGHGPSFGIRKKRNESWWRYSERQFDMGRDSDEWLWCFGDVWVDIDNTRLGAAKRIQYLINTGLAPAVEEFSVGLYDRVRVKRLA